ncbi:MAG: nitrilase-related carbon-nitrogen hydrolase [Anaerolineae bacterium]|jgi:predicted amidohydrolase
MKLTMALAQMAIATGRLEDNATTAQRLAAQAAARGVRLLLLPELWHTGYDLARAGEYAAPVAGGPDDSAFGQMAALARTHNLYVAGTALEANPSGRPYNTAAIFDPAGNRVGAYRKVHLWAPMGETEHMSAGADLPVFDLPWGRTAMAICYDLRFPELWRRYAEAGAQLVLIPAEWPARRVEHWRLLLRARAVENQFLVTGCNRAGGEPGAQPDATRFGGHSAIVDPWARVLVEGDSEPGLFVATVDMEEVTRARRLFPFLADRHPEVTG